MAYGPTLSDDHNGFQRLITHEEENQALCLRVFPLPLPLPTFVFVFFVLFVCFWRSVFLFNLTTGSRFLSLQLQFPTSFFAGIEQNLLPHFSPNLSGPPAGTYTGPSSGPAPGPAVEWGPCHLQDASISIAGAHENMAQNKMPVVAGVGILTHCQCHNFPLAT